MALVAASHGENLSRLATRNLFNWTLRDGTKPEESAIWTHEWLEGLIDTLDDEDDEDDEDELYQFSCKVDSSSTMINLIASTGATRRPTRFSASRSSALLECMLNIEMVAYLAEDFAARR
ncbi:hypothetical protein FOPE_10814 [Fonsecaea pedrosoi]|nr:hypothetical protein FOPE_10814 [Fonsecaea pedrosoi]